MRRRLSARIPRTKTGSVSHGGSSRSDVAVSDIGSTHAVVMAARSGVRDRFERSARYRSELRLLSGFELRRDDVPVPLPQSAQRLLALLAVHDRALERSRVAGSLWLDATDSHAAGSLRSALWRVNGVDDCIVEATSTRLRLAPQVRVDLRDGLALAHRLLESGELAEVGHAPGRVIAMLGGDLLPDWYVDDWLVPAREQWRQVRLHALEVLAIGLAKRGDFAIAVCAALASVRGEPLRESAHRCLVRVHLEEGNVGEAVTAFRRFQELLRSELGVEPSSGFVRLLGDLIEPRVPAPRRSS